MMDNSGVVRRVLLERHPFPRPLLQRGRLRASSASSGCSGHSCAAPQQSARPAVAHASRGVSQSAKPKPNVLCAPSNAAALCGCWPSTKARPRRSHGALAGPRRWGFPHRLCKNGAQDESAVGVGPCGMLVGPCGILVGPRVIGPSVTSMRLVGSDPGPGETGNKDPN